MKLQLPIEGVNLLTVARVLVMEYFLSRIRTRRTRTGAGAQAWAGTGSDSTSLGGWRQIQNRRRRRTRGRRRRRWCRRRRRRRCCWRKQATNVVKKFNVVVWTSKSDLIFLSYLNQNILFFQIQPQGAGVSLGRVGRTSQINSGRLRSSTIFCLKLTADLFLINHPSNLPVDYRRFLTSTTIALGSWTRPWNREKGKTRHLLVCIMTTLLATHYDAIIAILYASLCTVCIMHSKS